MQIFNFRLMEKEKKEQNLFTEDDFNLFEDVINSVEASDEADLEDQLIDELNDDKDIVEEDVATDTDDVDTEDQDDVVEDEDEEVVETDDNDDEDEDDENSSLFTPYAKLLVDNDILSTLDIEQFDGTAEGLKKAMENEISYHVSKYKEELPIEVKKLVDGYEKGIPFDEMLKISSDRIRYNNIDENSLDDNVEMQKNITRDYLKKTTKFNDSRIEKMIERLENNAELEEESKSNLKELRELQDVEEQEALERSRAEQEAYMRRQNEIMEQLKGKIESTEEIIPGVKVNKIMKDKITKNLTVPVAYDEYNQPINKIGLYSRKNPIEFEVMLNYIFEATNEFKDWGVFGKSGKSKAIQELEAVTKSLDNSRSVKKRSNKNSGDSYDLMKTIAENLK